MIRLVVLCAGLVLLAPGYSRLDEVQRRIRRLDERIVRIIAASTPGLLSQLRLLAAFYEESANGAGRRGSLLIQAIAEGLAQLEKTRPPQTTIRAASEASKRLDRMM